MRKIRYVIRRVLLAVLVLISVSIITFVIARVVPSDPAAQWVGPRATSEQIARARIQLGLDKPLPTQYMIYLGNLLKGDLGVSIKTHQPILRDLQVRLPATLELVLFSMLLASLIGIPIGVLAGAKPNSFLDHTSRLIAIAGVSMPNFMFGLLLQFFFYGYLKLLPIGSRVDRTTTLYHPIQHITGFNLIDTAITGNWVAFWDSLEHFILPAFTIGVFSIAMAIRMTRSTMIEVLEEKYITAARASGIHENTILFKLALKNAIIPTISILGLAFAYALTGAIVVEVIFSWPGLGTYVTDAILNVDFPVIIAVTLISTLFYVAINLALDLLQAFLDPRVSLQ